MIKRVAKSLHRAAHAFLEADEKELPAFLRWKAFRWVMVLLLAVVVTLITSYSEQPVPRMLAVGAIADRDIKANRDYEIVDEEATLALRDEAHRSIQAVYLYDEGLGDAILTRLHQAFREVRMMAYELTASGSKEEGEEQLQKLFVEKIGMTLTDDIWKMLFQERFSSRVEAILAQLVLRAMQAPVVAERNLLDAEKDRGIILRRLRHHEGKPVVNEENKITDFSRFVSLEEVRVRISKSSMSPQGLFRAQSRPTILTLASQLIQPNCVLDRQETEVRRAEAASMIESVMLKVSAGEMIIRDGSRLEARHVKILNGIQQEHGRGLFSLRLGGVFLVVLLFEVIPFSLARRFVRRFHPSRRDTALMITVGLVSLCILRAIISILPGVEQVFPVPIPDHALIYAAPVAFAVMLMRMFLSVETTLIFALPMTITTCLMGETGLRFMPFALMSNLAAVMATTGIDRRISIIRTGVWVGCANAIAVLGLKLMSSASLADILTLGGFAWHMIFAFAGGITSAIVTMVALPIVESLSGYVTDIKLLELANLNHPLLRELIVRAPGTYHHSHLVGILAEAAAEAIGANTLLVRVGAYYHDIGKMKKPSYYIENSPTANERHEKLAPHMSALIVASHVKDGIEMAEAHRVPRVIIDMIPQHHGTRMIGFFYEKAKAAADPEMETIDPKEFAYGGPKPQTREAAIMMLSDVTEAAVRSLKEKTPARVHQTVRRVMNDIFAESQLDECDLTLKDLNDIAEAFEHILLGIYHQRIEYPKEISACERGDDQPPSEVASPNPSHSEAPGKVAIIKTLRSS